jgi:hypothetical protein
VDIVAVTNAQPAVVSVATADIADFSNDDIVTIAGTGSPALDGKSFIIGSVGQPADSFTLLGSDNTSALTPADAGTATPVDDADWLRFCLASYEREVEAADAIDVSTFCGTESLAGTPLPGNITIEGFIDYSVEAYNEWLRAVQDGQRRLLHIVLPNDIGEILSTITVTGLTETLTTNEAAAFEGSAVLNEWPTYVTA